MHELNTLGKIDLLSPDRGSVRTLLAQPKRLLLLIYLLLETRGGYVRRDVLLALFWPESDESRARGSLRQALQFLRRSLGDETVLTRGDDEVGIDRSRIRCDALEFLACVDTERFDEALRLYHGPFLPGFLIDDASDAEAWISGQRQSLAQQAARCAGRLAATASAPDERLTYARRTVALAPLDESAARQLAEWLDETGDRAGALVELGELRRRLDAELQIAPSPETVALESQIRARSEAHAGRAAVVARRAAHEVAPAQPKGTPGRSWLPAGLAIAVIGLAGLGVWSARDGTQDESPSPIATGAHGAPIVVVAPFENNTGDSALAPVGAMISDWITEGLSRVDGLRIVPLTAVQAATRSLAAVANTSVSSMHLARDVGATVLVSGAAYKTGATLHLQARVTNVVNGTLHGAAQTVSVPTDSVMVGIDRLRTRVVASLAPLGDSVSHLSRAVAPPSYQAYRDYITGLEVFVRGDPARALTYFERSAAADTSYPMPRISAAIMLLNLGRIDTAVQITERLAGRREQLGPLERATLDMVEGMLQGDLAKVERAVKEQARIAPGTIGEYMVSEVARRRGRPHAALAGLRALGPDRGELRGWRPYWRELTAVLYMIRDHEKEWQAAQDAMRRFPGEPRMHQYAVRALAALGRTRTVDSVIELRSAIEQVAAPDAGELLYTAANELSMRGDSVAAQAYRKRELRWYEQLHERQRTASVRRRHARALWLTGGTAAARDTLRAVAASAPSTVPLLGLSGILALRGGDDEESSRLFHELSELDVARSAPERARAEGDIAYWRAARAAQEGDAVAAVAILRRAFAAGRSHDPLLRADPLFAPISRSAEFRQLVSYNQ